MRVWSGADFPTRGPLNDALGDREQHPHERGSRILPASPALGMAESECAEARNPHGGQRHRGRIRRHERLRGLRRDLERAM